MVVRPAGESSGSCSGDQHGPGTLSCSSFNDSFNWQCKWIGGTGPRGCGHGSGHACAWWRRGRGHGCAWWWRRGDGCARRWQRGRVGGDAREFDGACEGCGTRSKFAGQSPGDYTGSRRADYAAARERDARNWAVQRNRANSNATVQKPARSWTGLLTRFKRAGTWIRCRACGGNAWEPRARREHGRDRGNEFGVLFPFFGGGGYYVPTGPDMAVDAQGDGQAVEDSEDQGPAGNDLPDDRPYGRHADGAARAERPPVEQPAPQADVAEYVFVRRDGTVTRIKLNRTKGRCADLERRNEAQCFLRYGWFESDAAI